MGTFRALFRAHRGQVLGVLGLTVVAALAEAAGLALLSVLINMLMSGNAALPSPGVLQAIQGPVKANPRLFFLILGFTYVGKSVLTLMANYASIAVALKIADEWRLRLFAGWSVERRRWSLRQRVGFLSVLAISFRVSYAE